MLYMCIMLIMYLQQTVSTNPESVLYQEVSEYHGNTSRKAAFAAEVVDKIYKGFHQWFFTITYCEFTYLENMMLKYTETHGDGYPVLLLNGCPDRNRTRVKPRIDRHGQTAYLVTANDLNVDESEYVIKAFKRSGVFKPRSPVIFVVKELVTMDDYFYYILKNHFELLWSQRITNSVLIMKTNTMKIYSFNPFLNRVVEISKVKNISVYLSRMYRNLYGYKIKLSVFRKVYISEESGPVVCDSMLAVTVMQHMNATCEPREPRDANTVGDLLDNGTATGVTADLIDGYTDMELSSRILKNSYYGYIDTTYPLTEDSLCFVVKSSERQSTFATAVNLISINLLLVFAFVVLCLVILTIIVHVTESAIWKTQNSQTEGQVIMDLIKCFMKQTCDIKFWGPVYRMVIGMIIVYSLIVNCVIDGIIFTALSNPRNKPELDTIEDLVTNTNLTVAVHKRDEKLFNKSLTPEFYAALQNRTEIINDQKIKEIIEKRQFNYATLLMKSDAMYISGKLANLHNGRGIFYVMQECPVPSFIVYGLQYGSPYLPRLEFILSSLNEGGILEHWTASTSKYTLQKKLLSSSQKERKLLDKNILLEVFYVLFFGYFVSSFVLIVEMITFKFKSR